jgi:hypothetical protein
VTAPVVEQVVVADLRKIGKAEKPLYRQATVDEAVVDDEIGDAKERHPEADPKEQLPRDPFRAAASVEDERDGDRRVQNREGVVRLPPGFSRPMVRPVYFPQNPVPDRPVKELGPELHRYRHDQRRPDPERDLH